MIIAGILQNQGQAERRDLSVGTGPVGRDSDIGIQFVPL
jgi:hypothetical protein